MAQAFTLIDGWSADLTLATPTALADDAAGLSLLPTEWQTIDRVVLDDTIIDQTVVGPNGVFTVTVDPDPIPATIEWDGLFRDGARVTTTVKNALMSAHALRQRIGAQLFAYPLLVTTIKETDEHLGRLGVVATGRVAEAIWCHAGSPLTRTQRMDITRALRGLTK